MTTSDQAPPACPPGALLVPLTGRGGVIRGWALVDEADRSVLDYRWHLTAKGYARRLVPREGGGQAAMPMQRQIMGLGPTSGPRTRERVEVDHEDGNRLDNRRSNLRLTTPAGQAQNVRQQPGKYSQHRGVSKFTNGRPKPWIAYAYHLVDGKKRRVGLGTYATEEEAAAVASAWRAEHMPFSTDAQTIRSPA